MREFATLIGVDLEAAQCLGLAFEAEGLHDSAPHMTADNDDVRLDPALGREVLEQLLMDAELAADLERIEKLTPQQLEEEMRSAGVTPGQGRERALRAIEKATARRGPEAEKPKRGAHGMLDDLLEEAWVSRIGAMTPAEIRQLAAGSRLAGITDQQVEAVLRCAKERIEEEGS